MEQNKLTLEKLIDMALVDGVVTDKERELIRRKAEREGYDPDEAEMVLDAKLQELQIQQQADVAKVKRCPNCGEPIPAASLVCPACGFEYQKAKANSSFTELSKKLDEVEKGRKDLSNTSDDDKIVAEAVRIANIKRQVISTFPIPNTKDDLVEFITMSSGLTIKKFPLGDTLIGRLLVILLITLVIGTLILLVLVIADVDDEIIENTSAGICLFFILGCMAYGLYGKNPDRLEHNILADAWKSKVNQCMAKAKMMITNSAELAQLDSIANPPKEGFSLMGFIKNVLNK